MLYALCSLFLPGIGQVLLSRHARGVIIFFSIIILLDIALIILPLYDGSAFGVYGAKGATLRSEFMAPSAAPLYALCFIVYAYNLWDIFNIVYWSNRRALKEKKKTILKRAITYYLKADIDSSRDELKKALKLDKEDINVLYYLSKVWGGGGGSPRSSARSAS
ncbi:MAG: hypothetical protein QME51_02880, partial [Planctomycetota bacterium]|nr:hypothetical protein [Planctomycetota bacterium]